jgi:farnesyl-diphosphate farnesyltransferase
MVTSRHETHTGTETTLPARLDAILRQTSRSVYLTLRVAPAPLRRQLMLGYLFCRAADTIADTRVLPPVVRVEILEIYRGQFGDGDPDLNALSPVRELAERTTGEGFSAGEKALLAELDACFEIYCELESRDRELFRRLLRTLTVGMAMDLETFPNEEEARAAERVVPLETLGDLDRYCYHVAGCVGEFWTDLHVGHVPEFSRLDRDEMVDLGVRFGKGLQMTNVLRDLPEDLRIGRCYLPREIMQPAGVESNELLQALSSDDERQLQDLVTRMTPVLDRFLDHTLEHFEAGWNYTLRIPRRLIRSRLACCWPLLIGLETLTLLRHDKAKLLRGDRLKTTRKKVYGLLAASSMRIWSNRGLDALYRRLEANASLGSNGQASDR